MLRKTLLVLCVLALVPFSVAYGQGGGNGKAMTPVGTWDLTYSGEWIPPYKLLWTVNFGGTSVVTAQGFPSEDPLVAATVWGASTGHGVWRKVSRKTYIHTIFTLVPWFPGEPGPVADLRGYVKAVNEFTLIDRNILEGRCVISIVEGPDPTQPPVITFPEQQFVGYRLRPERLPMP